MIVKKAYIVMVEDNKVVQVETLGVNTQRNYLIRTPDQKVDVALKESIYMATVDKIPVMFLEHKGEDTFFKSGRIIAYNTNYTKIIIKLDDSGELVYKEKSDIYYTNEENVPDI